LFQEFTELTEVVPLDGDARLAALLYGGAAARDHAVHRLVAEVLPENSDAVEQSLELDVHGELRWWARRSLSASTPSGVTSRRPTLGSWLLALGSWNFGLERRKETARACV